MRYDHNLNKLVSPSEEIDVTITAESLGIYNKYGSLDFTKDAFGRSRVGLPYTLFDSHFDNSDNYNKWNSKTTGNASATFSSNISSVSMTVGHEASAEVIRETRRTFAYQPGKSLLILSSFVFASAQTNLRQRMGFFSRYNANSGDGIYLELDDETLYIVKRSSVSGTIVNTRVPQSEWNINKLDGTDNNHIILDISKAQIFWVDIEWLGVGSVRTGFIINGQFVLCHVFHHANIESNVYMTEATLPLRLEITNKNTTEQASTLKHICNSVISEGGFDALSLSRSASTPITGRKLANGINNPIISIRLREGKMSSIAIPETVNMYGVQNQAFQYQIIRDGTVGNASWVSGQANSAVEYDITGNTISGGVTIQEGVFSGKTNFQVSLGNMFNHHLQLTRNIDATVGNTLTVAVTPTTNNDDIVASFNWREATI